MTKMSCLFYFFQPAWYLFSRYVFQIHTNCLNVWHDTKKVSSLSEPHFDKARKPILSVFLLDCSTCTSFFFIPVPRRRAFQSPAEYAQDFTWPGVGVCFRKSPVVPPSGKVDCRCRFSFFRENKPTPRRSLSPFAIRYSLLSAVSFCFSNIFSHPLWGKLARLWFRTGVGVKWP